MSRSVPTTDQVAVLDSLATVAPAGLFGRGQALVSPVLAAANATAVRKRGQLQSV